MDLRRQYVKEAQRKRSATRYAQERVVAATLGDVPQSHRPRKRNQSCCDRRSRPGSRRGRKRHTFADTRAVTTGGTISLERFLQWLDDLDDLYGAARLLSERMRRLAWTIARMFTLLSVGACGVVAALREPPLGLAVAILLFVFLLYRSVTQPGFAARGRRAAA